jgi:hypothetical protein
MIVCPEPMPLTPGTIDPNPPIPQETGESRHWRINEDDPNILTL